MLSLSSLRNQESGKRAFILGNGPSVRQENLSLLVNELVIGMNASPLLDREFGFSSKYYTLSDLRFLNHPIKREYATTMLSKGTVRVVRAELAADDDKALSGHTAYVKALARDGFSWNLRSGFFYGCTTTMLALQLAAYLDCGEVYLLGMDLRYSADQPRFYAEENPQFDDPFTSVQIRNIVTAARALAVRGKRVVLCSERSFLRPYLPFRSFSDVVSRQVQFSLGEQHKTQPVEFYNHT